MLGKINNFKNRTTENFHDFGNKPVRYFCGLAFLIMFPFYLWSSGYPQIADLFFVGICGPLLIAMFLQIRTIGSNDMILFMFAGLTLLINTIHYFYHPDIRFFLSSGYYLYNAFVFIYFRHAFAGQSPEKIKQVLFYVFMGSAVFLLLFGLGFNSSLGGRLISTFNNPNQLAYWGVLVGCITVVLNQGRFGFAPLSILLICTTLVVMTVSRNGLIIMLALWVVCLLTTRTTTNVKYVMIFLGVLAIIFASIVGISIFASDGVSGAYFEAFSRRFMLQDNFLDAVFYNRGYGRILENPYWLIVGAGEGGFDRFPYGTRELELHSGLATLIFGYGIIGTGLFFLFIFQFLKRSTPTEFYVVGLLMAFNITHQALRFSMFWVFLGILAYLQIERTKYRNKVAQAQGAPHMITRDYEHIR